MCLSFGVQPVGLVFPFGFLCANTGLAYYLKSNFVMMPYLCSRASSTRMSLLRLIGARRLLLKAGLLSKSVSCTLNSVLIPMSNRCRLKMSQKSTTRSSTACLASGCRVKSIQSKVDRN